MKDQQIINWFKEGVNVGFSYLIVVCDTFGYENYPVYVATEDELHPTYDRYNGVEMQKVVEIYNLTSDMDAQLKQEQTFSVPENFWNIPN